MAASSSSHSSPEHSSSSDHVPTHDIFLSHSGAQKPFVTALYGLLRQKRYSTFLDIHQHSLPLGEPFPPHIFNAAQTCRLAVVVLSEQFVLSKWPMLELQAFFAANPPPNILPLFLELTISDLKQKGNFNRWRSVWQRFAEEDPDRINVSAWESAIKRIPSYSGIIRNQCEDERDYIERVVSRICESVRPSIRYDFSGIHGIHRLSEIVLNEFGRLEDNQSKVCVLGMHGLPGSGKSTICRYLCESLSPKFAGKAIYLELPSDANDEELLVKAKELLKQLTNFHNKMDLSHVSKFREVFDLLRGTDFVRSRVFLIVDNISTQKSNNAVQGLLRLGLTVGSKVLLVARSFEVLSPLLEADVPHQYSNYVHGSLNVPSLNEEEALELLLQSGDGVGLVDCRATRAALNPRDKKIMVEVINMSAFSEEHGRSKVYVPLVLKIVGEQLKVHELNVEKWSRTMKSFQRDIGLCKEEALKIMVLKSFETLWPRSIQTLFLDVALFIVPLSHLDGESHMLDEACSHLSLIHGCESEKIKFQMQQLQQHGFLTIREEYWKRKDPFITPTLIISVHDFYLEFAASMEEASKYYWSSGLRHSKVQCKQAIEVVASTQRELRTVVVDDEQYEHFEISPNFLGVKAMVLRNCMSLKIVLGIANLRNLVSLEIWNCPSLKWVEVPVWGYTQPYVRRVQWVNRDSKKLQLQELESSSSKKSIWSVVWENLAWISFKRFQCKLLGGLLLQMNGLEVLRLENTGTREYMDMNRCLPQLRVLEVKEDCLKGLSVCNLPNLERLVCLGGGGEWPSLSDVFICIVEFSEPRKNIMVGNGFLAGCPKVQKVCVQCTTFENVVSLESTHLEHLAVSHVRLPNLRIAASEFLKIIEFADCKELISLDLTAGFRNLRDLMLLRCADLIAVSGFGEFPQLHFLEIKECPNLKQVSGVRNLVSLIALTVSECPKLGLRSSERVSELDLAEVCDRSGCSSILVDDLPVAFGIEKLCCFYLTSMSLCTLENLKSLNGIEFLGSLMRLDLMNLPNLSCLRGIECLERLKHLNVEDCASVVEIPSLATLVNLVTIWFSGCEKLRSVEGCMELKRLREACFLHCKSLAHFPWDLKQRKNVRLPSAIRIKGCKFASEEVVAAWAVDEEYPMQLRVASLLAIAAFLRTASRLMMIEMIMDKLVQKAFMLLDEEEGDDERVFVAHISSLANGIASHYETSGTVQWPCSESPDKALRCVAKLPKQCLVDLCNSNAFLPYFLCLLLCPSEPYSTPDRLSEEFSPSDDPFGVYLKWDRIKPLYVRK